MFIKKENAKKKKNTDSCYVWEYFESDKIGFATALINGRYPDSGKAVNQECEEIYFVISGKGNVHKGGKGYHMEQGDMLFFDKGQEYWVEGDNMEVVIVTAPPWFFEQYKIVD